MMWGSYRFDDNDGVWFIFGCLLNTLGIPKSQINPEEGDGGLAGLYSAESEQPTVIKF